ncbi:MAG: DUF262 domain-containing protein [Clostridia bacterium]|nr:DUF262 domain-containing protein [Clostridia bacterium]
MGKRLEFSLESYALMTLISDIRIIEFGGLDLRPKYQRNYIWRNDFKDKLIYSIIKSYPIGSIIIRKLKEPNEKGAKSEIVDGQQRMTTIYEFIEGKYEIRSEFSRKIIEEIQEIYGEKTDHELERLKKKLGNKGSIKLKYSDFPAVIRGKFEAFNMSITKIIEADEVDITEYFRFLQNQERLRAGEILNSLSDSKMEKYLLEIENLEEFCNIIGFDNDRKEFDKLFYSVVGLLDNKLSLGVPDSTIRKYVTTEDKITEGQAEFQKLIEQINYITHSFQDAKILINTKKRYVKFMLLLMGFGLVDFTIDTENRLKALEIIDSKLSVFFSSKPDVVQKEFEGYSSEIIEELRSVALISRGAQIIERVKNRMEILAYYIQNVEEKEMGSKVIII